MTAGSLPCATGHVAPPGGRYCIQCGTAFEPGDQVIILWPPPRLLPLATPPAPEAHAAPQYPAPQYPAALYPAAQYPAAQYPAAPHGAPGYAYPVPASRAMNGMAIASMVLGILWIYWIGSILALVFGYVALSQIKSRNERGRGMAIAGVVLGWIGVGLGLLIVTVALIDAARSGTGL
jgi:hypothetical protein